MGKYRHRGLAIACVASLFVGFRTFQALFGRAKIGARAFFASFRGRTSVVLGKETTATKVSLAMKMRTD